MNHTLSKISEYLLGFAFVYIGGVLIINDGNHVKSLLMASFITAVVALFEVGRTLDNTLLRFVYLVVYSLFAAATIWLVATYLLIKLTDLDGGWIQLAISLSVASVGGAITGLTVDSRYHKRLREMK